MGGGTGSHRQRRGADRQRSVLCGNGCEKRGDIAAVRTEDDVVGSDAGSLPGLCLGAGNEDFISEACRQSSDGHDAVTGGGNDPVIGQGSSVIHLFSGRSPEGNGHGIADDFKRAEIFGNGIVVRIGTSPADRIGVLR